MKSAQTSDAHRHRRTVLLIRTIAVPLISAVLGAVAVAGTTYFVSQSLLTKEQRLAQAAAAYADYLTYVSKKEVHLAFLRDKRPEDIAPTDQINSDIVLDEIMQNLVASKSRIGIFGSKDVVL